MQWWIVTALVAMILLIGGGGVAYSFTKRTKVFIGLQQKASSPSQSRKSMAIAMEVTAVHQ